MSPRPGSTSTAGRGGRGPSSPARSQQHDLSPPVPAPPTGHQYRLGTCSPAALRGAAEPGWGASESCPRLTRPPPGRGCSTGGRDGGAGGGGRGRGMNLGGDKLPSWLGGWQGKGEKGGKGGGARSGRPIRVGQSRTGSRRPADGPHRIGAAAGPRPAEGPPRLARRASEKAAVEEEGDEGMRSRMRGLAIDSDETWSPKQRLTLHKESID